MIYNRFVRGRKAGLSAFVLICAIAVLTAALVFFSSCSPSAVSAHTPVAVDFTAASPDPDDISDTAETSVETEDITEEETEVVPDVTDMTGDEAVSAVLNAGFLTETVYSHSETVDEGYVVCTLPAYPDTASKGDTVLLEISLGSAAIPVRSVSISKSRLTLYMGDMQRLSVTVSPSDATDADVLFSSSDSSVATVSSDGTVSGRNAGSAVITALCGEKSASCTVTVLEKTVYADAVRFYVDGDNGLSLVYGDTYTLTLAISPGNVSDNTVHLVSSDRRVLSVSGFTLTALRPGVATITGYSGDGKASASLKVTVTGRGEAVLLDAPYIDQRTDYPVGCEIVSTAMALNYIGLDVTVEELTDEHLPLGPFHYSVRGIYYGPDPDEYFSGSPYASNGYGCYSPVIIKMLNSYLDRTKYVVYAPKSKTLDQLCSYIDEGLPVIVWATESMSEAKNTIYWTKLIPSGESWKPVNKIIHWISPEHCLLLVGYDDDFYYFNDPLAGKQFPYLKEECETAFDALGSQALVVAESKSK